MRIFQLMLLHEHSGYLGPVTLQHYIDYIVEVIDLYFCMN